MKMTNLKKSFSLILCIVLIAAMTLFTTGCNDDKEPQGALASEMEVLEGGDLGEGETEFAFTVVDAEGKETAFTIHTDRTVVGEALQELGLIAGEEGDYGLYVKTVNGITLDYDADGMYWAFYVDGEYAMSGVDTTEITEGGTYSFKAEK